MTTNVRHRLGRGRRLLRYRDAFADDHSGRAVVAYLGWTGEGNIGDESMFLAHQMFMGHRLRFVPIPSLPANRVLTLAAKRFDAVCLGGGTLIANAHFAESLDAVAAELKRDRPYFMIGTGCEDSEYRVGKRQDLDDALDQWSRLLPLFDQVRVRGPRSVATLAQRGVKATVTGDPALALPMLGVQVVPRLIGLNVGVTDDQWGSDKGGRSEFADELVSALLSQGYSVRLCSTTDEDFKVSVQLASRWPGRVECPPVPLDVFTYLAWTGACDALIGLKLHAQILATTQLRPVIALEYRPKCADFMESVGRGHRCMRTDHLDVDTLLSWVSEDIADVPAQQDLAEQVAARKAALLDAFATEADKICPPRITRPGSE